METVTITHLGQHGDGVAEGPIYVPLTAPGDVVSGVREGDTLRDIRIQTPSDLRIKANCRHFKSCGGCVLQHIRDDAVADWKAMVIRDTLAQRDITTEVRETLTSPPQSRRRATFAVRRTKSGGLVGFHARGSDTVISVADCTLLSPSLAQAMPSLQDLALLGASRKHGLDVTVTETLNGLDIAVTGGKPLDPALQANLAQLAEREGWARVTWNRETAALCAPSSVSFDGITVPMPPGAFLQATTHGEATLLQLVQSIVGHAKRIVDLFAGCGTFALPLARRAEVLAFEGEQEMVSALLKGWRNAGGLKRVEARTRDLFRDPLQPDEFRKIDAVVIDPPRAGASAQINALGESQIETIAHVSCNPQTFARDAQTLIKAGFSLDWVQPVDQFRWSPHSELVGAFRR